jgi:hypothetical protein
VKLRTFALQSKLRLTALAIKLRVALGEFVFAITTANNFSASDTPSKQPRKDRAETLSLADQTTVVPNKRPNDTVNITDGGEGPYFAEDYVTGAPLSQTYTLVGGFNWVLTKILQDLPVVTDQLVKALPSKSILDGVNATDDVNGAATGDDQIVQYFKVTSNLASASDGTLARAVSKILSDIGAATDAGSLRMQNYTVDGTYFAEDYVGTSAAFS